MTEAATATVAFSLETWPSGPQCSQCRLCALVEFLASEPEQRPHLQNKAVQRLDRERQEPASFVLTGTSQFLLIHRRVSSGFSTMRHLYPARWGWSPRPSGINKKLPVYFIVSIWVWVWSRAWDSTSGSQRARSLGVVCAPLLWVLGIELSA